MRVGVHRLDNDRWGFESNCFVCEQHNERGMQLPFFHDDERDVVFAEYTLGDEFSGAPTYVHGGVTLAVVDEAMAWAAIAIAIGGKFAFTKETTAEFEWPVRLDRPYTLEARVVEQDRRRYVTEAEILDSKSRVCVRAQAVMSILDMDQATDAIGTDVSGDDTGFVR